MKTQIPIIATRCINICPTRLKHDHYDGPALSLHARAPPRRPAPSRLRAPPRPVSQSRSILPRTGQTLVRTRAGSRGPGLLAVMSCSRKTRGPCRDPEQLTGPGVTGLLTWTVRANIPDNNVMVSSHSRHLAIMSSLARTRPKPYTHHTHPAPARFFNPNCIVQQT